MLEEKKSLSRRLKLNSTDVVKGKIASVCNGGVKAKSHLRNKVAVTEAQSQDGDIVSLGLVLLVAGELFRDLL